MIDDDGVDVPSEDHRDGSLVFRLSRLAKVNDSAVYAWKREQAEESQERAR